LSARCDHPVHSEIESEDPAELEPTGPDRSKVACRITPDEMSIVVPPIGWRPITWFILMHTTLWNGLVWFFLFDALRHGAPDVFGMLFLMPFFLVGIVTALLVLFLVTGESVLLMDQQTVSLSLFLFGNKSFTRVRQIEQLESVTRTTCYSINSVPVYGIGLAFSEGGPFRFGLSLDDQEIHRLMTEIRCFWKS